MRGDLGGAERVQGADERRAPKTAGDVQQRHSAKGQHAQRVALSSVLPSQHALRNTHARTRTHASTHTRAHTNTPWLPRRLFHIFLCASLDDNGRHSTTEPWRSSARAPNRPRMSRRMRGRAAGGRQSHASSTTGSTGANKGKRKCVAMQLTRLDIHNRRAPVQGRRYQWRVYASSQGSYPSPSRSSSRRRGPRGEGQHRCSMLWSEPPSGCACMLSFAAVALNSGCTHCGATNKHTGRSPVAQRRTHGVSLGAIGASVRVAL